MWIFRRRDQMHLPLAEGVVAEALSFYRTQPSATVRVLPVLGEAGRVDAFEPDPNMNMSARRSALQLGHGPSDALVGRRAFVQWARPLGVSDRMISETHEMV